MTGHRSVFPSQLLSMKKSEAIDIKLGQEIINSQTSYTTRFFINIQNIINVLLKRSKKDTKENTEDKKE